MILSSPIFNTMKEGHLRELIRLLIIAEQKKKEVIGEPDLSSEDDEENR